jgi:hypothetical protein
VSYSSIEPVNASHCLCAIFSGNMSNQY